MELRTHRHFEKQETNLNKEKIAVEIRYGFALSLRKAELTRRLVRFLLESWENYSFKKV